MDQFLQDELHGDIFWYDEMGPVNRSAFVPYISRPRNQTGIENSCNGSNSTNMNKRMIEFTRRTWPVKIEAQESEGNRCYRHMMSERMRREREKKGYLALHSILPLGTKNDKNSITQMAAKRILELKRYKDVLERENGELEARLATMESGNVERTRIRINLPNPTSGVDSMVEVLKCLKSLGLKPTSIQSTFSNQEFQAVLEIENEIEAAEVEKAVKRTLQGVERKLQFDFPEA